jgi:hypothetical protein
MYQFKKQIKYGNWNYVHIQTYARIFYNQKIGLSGVEDDIMEYDAVSTGK